MPDENNYFEEIIKNLNGIYKSIESLDRKIEEQNQRIFKLESGQASVASPVSVTPVISPPPPPPPPSINLNPQGIEFSQPQPSSSYQSNTPQQNNLEENIGGKWFARIGIMALVLGISFFLKYAFDNNWIGPIGRVAIGIISGVILLGLGEKFIRKYSVYGQILSGGGLAVLYLSIFAAFDFYQLIGQIPAFFMMILITSAGIALSIRYNALSLIIVSTLGGFATPFLISTGKNNEIGLFSYILLLDLAILAVSVFKKWRELNIIGFLGTALVFLTWSVKFYQEDEMFVTMLFLTLFFVTYSISSLIYNLVKNEKSFGTEQVLTLMAGTVYFGASYAILDSQFHDFMGFFALLLAVYYFLWAYAVRSLTPEDENLYSFLAFLTIGFVTLAIPLQFDGKLITVGWTIEAIILLLLGIKTKQAAIKAFGIIIFGLATLRMIFIDSEHEANDTAFFNGIILTYIIVIASAYISAHIFKRFSEEENGSSNFLPVKQLVAMFLITANFLTIYSVSREIVYSYDQEIELIQDQMGELYSNQSSVGSGSFRSDSSYREKDKLLREKMKKIENQSSVSLSLFWLFYGIILMLVGFFARIKGVRIGGMLLFMLAILKLFFYDLWSLGTLYRIISSISLGIVLLSISFAYQKYKDKIKEII
jgi:uncharacterized membrane protein